MLRTNHFGMSYLAAPTTLALVVLQSMLFGQTKQVDVPSARHHILLPPSYGATPLSTILHASAALTAARGDFLESMANARLTNSIAAKQEMENSVEWVRTYFKRKEINRMNTRRPDFIEREQGRIQSRKQLIESDYQIELQADPSDKLNFMLDELIVNALPQDFYPGSPNTFVDSAIDRKLSPDDVHHIRLTDGGGGSARLEFRADDVALQTRWPRVLRSPKLEKPRVAVEWARDAAVDELRATGELRYSTSQDLKDKVDALTKALNEAYPKKRRTESMRTFSEFLAGERFLQSFAIGVVKMITEEDQRAFDGSFRFEGDSVADLVAHMHKFGLKFLPRQPGDEGVYQTLFATMRHFYRTVAAGRSPGLSIQ